MTVGCKSTHSVPSGVCVCVCVLCEFTRPLHVYIRCRSRTRSDKAAPAETLLCVRSLTREPWPLFCCRPYAKTVRRWPGGRLLAWRPNAGHEDLARASRTD
jgi:hypothetical protein